MTDVERLELFVIASDLRPRLNSTAEQILAAIDHATDAVTAFIAPYGRKLPKDHVCRAILLALKVRRKAKIATLIEVAESVCAMLLAAIDMQPGERVTNQEWYVRARSKRRGVRARVGVKCRYCENAPVTPGTWGKKVNRPFSSCKACRGKNKAKQRRLRAEWRNASLDATPRENAS